MERKALRNSTRKVRRKDSKGTFSLMKIAHHLMKIVTVKKKLMREYCLWPSIISKRHLMKKEKKRLLRLNFQMK